MNACIRFYLCTALLCSISACGGGGGSGSSEAFYGGIWRFQGQKAVDDCSLGLPGAVDHTHTVNQAENRIVLDSGRLVFEGKTQSEDDGFTVDTSSFSDGCSTASAISYKEASDGEAATGLAIVSSCGRLTCSVGWGGVARRSAGRVAADSSSASDLIDAQLGRMPEALLTRSTNGSPGMHTEALELARALAEQAM